MTQTGQREETASLSWHDVRQWGIEGKGWRETERYYDRLPARAKGVVREPVWNLSRHAAGMCAWFETDATAIWARWELLLPELAMVHMPATGKSGLDLYVEAGGRLRWLGVGRPTQFPTNEQVLADGMAPGRRRYLLYLPLYNGVESVEIGLPSDAGFTPIPPRAGPPVVFYGTSILQGGCASRPGMCHAAILGRRLGVPIVNLGFSGNGRMEPELAELLAELDPSVYVIDCLPNLDPGGVAERAEPFVRRLGQAHPRTPIVLVEDRTYDDAHLRPARRERNLGNRAALRAAYDRLLQDGVAGLTYVPGEALFGDDGDATVDGSHPTDLGFARMAGALEPVLRSLL